MKIVTLGGLSLEGGVFRRQKPLLLLTYLCLEGRTSRRELAELFWPTSADSRDSLSTTIRRLNRHCPGLIVGSGSFVSTAVKSDWQVVRSSISDGDFATGLTLYGGPFLQDLDIPLGNELEEWIFERREEMALRVREAALCAAESSCRAREVNSARRFLEDFFFLREAGDPDPQSVRRADAILRNIGHGQAGELRRRVHKLLQGLDAWGQARPAAPTGRSLGNNLPAPLGPFIGRRRELEELEALLAVPGVRLVTVVGPGGAGKSRVALETAYRQVAEGSFDSVAYAGLDSFRRPEDLLSAISAALAAGVHGGGDSLDQLSRRIGTRQLLLVLDNFEHLVQGAQVTSELLRACPNLKLLCTSRSRLGTQAEWLFPLDGLPLPEPDAPQSALEGDWDAFELFVTSARRLDPGYRLEPEKLPDLARICRAVHGLPLGIELAAAWTATSSEKAIAERMIEACRGLGTRVRDVPDRHRSLSATIDHSWRLLRGDEARSLAALSIFRGGFEPEAALAVCGVGPTMLERLVARSVVRVGRSGRYDLHPLIEEYARAQLNAGPVARERVSARHGEYFLTQLRGENPSLLVGSGARQTLSRISRDMANFRQAWQWALELRRHEYIYGLVTVWGQYGEVLGRYSDCLSLMSMVEDSFDERDAELQLALGAALGLKAFLTFRTGDLTGARSIGTRALEILRRPGAPEVGTGLWWGLHSLGISNFMLGRYEEAYLHTRNAITVARRLGDTSLEADAVTEAAVLLGISLHILGMMDTLRGDWLTALDHLEGGAAVFRELGSPHLCYALSDLSLVRLQQGRQDEAEELLDEAEAVATAAANTSVLTDLHGLRARLHLGRGRLQEAREALDVGRSLAFESVNTYAEPGLLATDGWIELASGNPEGALQSFRTALEVAAGAGLRVLAMEPVLGLATIAETKGERELAATLGEYLLAESVTPAAVRGQAADLRGRLAMPALSGRIPQSPSGAGGRRYRRSADHGVRLKLSEIVDLAWATL